MTRHRIPRYSDFSLRVKLLAPFLLVMVVWGGVGSYVLARGAVGDAHARATVMLAPDLTADQRKAVKAFDLGRWLPTLLSSRR